MIEVLCAPTMNGGRLHCPIRADEEGSGLYGASRGKRKHTGIDLAAPAGSVLLSPVCGYVTKLGYPYGDDLSFRYVQVSTLPDGGDDYRFFYVKPRKGLEVGEQIERGDRLGRVQTLQNRYPGIIDHVHFEVINADGEYVDPTPRLFC
jgi:murein DD-endopeptidase MepM/ murein hydrolase activator NlpD